MPLRVERELALERLAAICDQKFFSVRASQGPGRVAQPTPAFCCVSNDNETANAACLLCAAHACDETSMALTRAGGAPRSPPLPRLPPPL